jgi:uncharacterized protein (TIGR00369 family)
MGFREHVQLQVEPGEEGEGRVHLDAVDEHLNPHGTVHGGVLATMLDVAMGTAVATAGGESPVTVSLTVTYLEPGRPGRLTARAKVRKRGKRLIVVEGQVEQDSGEGTDVVADALATFSVKA